MDLCRPKAPPVHPRAESSRCLPCCHHRRSDPFVDEDSGITLSRPNVEQNSRIPFPGSGLSGSRTRRSAATPVGHQQLECPVTGALGRSACRAKRSRSSNRDGHDSRARRRPAQALTDERRAEAASSEPAPISCHDARESLGWVPKAYLDNEYRGVLTSRDACAISGDWLSSNYLG